MRKAVYVGLALVLCVLALVGCSSPTAPADPDTSEVIGRDSALTGPFLPVPVIGG